LDDAFGTDKTFTQRANGTLSHASDFFPIAKAAGLGIQTIAHIEIGLGCSALREAVAAATSIVRDVGGQHSSLDLQAIEKGAKGEPHTLKFHVGKSVAELLQRFVSERIQRSSTYTDLASAQRSTDYVIGKPENQAKIATWLRGGAKGTQVLDGSVPGDSIGWTISRLDVEAGLPAKAANDARVVLKADSSWPTGYTILTSYPTNL
jgi:hypothetical protein